MSAAAASPRRPIAGKLALSLATALVLFGLAQAPELWLGPGGR